MKQSTRQPGNAVIWAAMVLLLLVWFLPNYLREVREGQKLLAEQNRICQLLEYERVKHKRLQEYLKKPDEHWKPWRYIRPNSDEKIFRFEAKDPVFEIVKLSRAFNPKTEVRRRTDTPVCRTSVFGLNQLDGGSPSVGASVHAGVRLNDIEHYGSLSVRDMLAGGGNARTARIALKLGRNRISSGSSVATNSVGNVLAGGKGLP